MKQRKPNRLKGYDYSQENLYFVTSCVQDMICCFGDIVVGTGRDLSVDDANVGTGSDLFDNETNIRTGRDLSLREPQMVLNQYGKIAEQQWYWLVQQYPYINLHEFIVMPNHLHGIIEIVGTGRDLSLRVLSLRNPSLPKINSLSELMGAYKMTVSKQTI